MCSQPRCQPPRIQGQTCCNGSSKLWRTIFVRFPPSENIKSFRSSILYNDLRDQAFEMQVKSLEENLSQFKLHEYAVME